MVRLLLQIKRKHFLLEHSRAWRCQKWGEVPWNGLNDCVSFEENQVANGFGNHLARSILRDKCHEDLSFEDCAKLLEKMYAGTSVRLYHDRSATKKLQIAKKTEEGVTVSEPYSLKTFWEFSGVHKPQQLVLQKAPDDNSVKPNNHFAKKQVIWRSPRQSEIP